MEVGHEMYGMAVASDDDSPAKRFYEKLNKEFKLNAPNVLTVMGMAQGMYTVRAIEHAVKEFGAQGDRRESARGAVHRPDHHRGDLRHAADAEVLQGGAVPRRRAETNIATVKGGKYQIAATGVDVPKVNKW